MEKDNDLSVLKKTATAFKTGAQKIKEKAVASKTVQELTELLRWIAINKAKEVDIALYTSIILFIMTMWAYFAFDPDKKNDSVSQSWAVVATSEDDNAEQEERKELLEHFINQSSKTNAHQRMYNPNDADFIDKFVDENWFDILVGLAELETWYGTNITKHTGETRSTWLFGLTWIYVKNDKGGYDALPCNNKNLHFIKKMTDAEKWEQIKIHIKYRAECLARIRDALIKNNCNQISAQQLLALLFVGYQKPNETPLIIDQIKEDSTDQEIADAFLIYPNKAKGHKEGTLKRRWWCAMYYLGKIDTDTFLGLKRDAFSSVKYDDLITINEDTNQPSCKIDQNTIESAIETAKTLKICKTNSVEDFMNNDPLLRQIYKNRYNNKNLVSNTQAPDQVLNMMNNNIRD